MIADIKGSVCEWTEFACSLKSCGDNTPLILFTGIKDKDLIIKALNSGFDFYLDKGDSPEMQIAALAEKAVSLTERKQIEDRLLQTGKGTIFRQMPLPFVLISLPGGVFAAVNDFFLQNTGYSKEEVIGKNSRELGIFADEDRYQKMIHSLMDKNFIKDFELHIRMKSGEIRICRMFSRIILIGKKRYVISTVEDVTELKASEEAFNMIVKGMARTSGRDSLERITEGLCDIFSAECALIGDFFDGDNCINVLSMHFKGKKYSDFSMSLIGTPCDSVRKNGFCLIPEGANVSLFENESFGSLDVCGYMGASLYSPEGKNTGVICVLSEKKLKSPILIRDIMDVVSAKASVEISRLKTVDMLLESEKKFRTLVELSLDGILILDYGGNILFVNNSAAGLIEAENVLGIAGFKNVMDYIAPVSRDDAINDLKGVASGMDGYPAEYQICSVKNNKKWVESIGKAINFEGKPAILISLRDISDRKNMESALKNEIARRRILQDQSRDGIVILEEDGSVFEFNESFSNMLGYTAEETKNLHIADWDHYFPKENLAEMLNTVDEKGDHFETRHFRKDGTEIDVDICSTAAVFSGKKLILCVCRDITERKRSEEAVKMANLKLNLLSNISCHDIYNKVIALQIFLNLLEDKKLADPEILQYLVHAKDAVRVMEKQIEFSRSYQTLGVKEPEWLNVIDLVKSLPSCDGIAIINNCRNVLIYADAMLEKVFYNFYDNTLRHSGGAEKITVSCMINPDSSLSVICEDNGHGIRDELKEKIFEQGFGENTGFGLFITREVLGITGIEIRENGKYGESARFEILVPKDKYRVSDENEELIS